MQLEALGKVNELFPNATPSSAVVEIVIDESPTDGDAEADLGLPFMDVHGGDDEAGPDLMD